MNRAGKLRIIYSLIVLLVFLIVANCNRIVEQRKHYYYNRGMKLFNDSDYGNAVKEFEKALQIDKHYLDAQYMKGMSNYSLGNYGAALSPLMKVSEVRQKDLPLKMKIAECAINSYGSGGIGRYIQVTNYFKSVIVPLADKNREARIVLLKYYIMLNKLIEAEKIIERFLHDGEESADFYVALVQFNLKKNKMSEVEDIALKHFSYTPDWMKTMQQVVAQLTSARKYDVLEKIYVKTIEQTKDKLPYQKALLEQYCLRGEGEKEEKLFRELLKSYPDNLQVKTEYVNFLMRYKRQGEAESFINEEITKQPENIQLKKMRIDLLVQSGQMQEAYQQTEEMVRVIPRDTKKYIEFQNILADICFGSGEYGKAKIIAEEILSKYQRDRDARFLLCKIYIQEKKALPAIGELRLLVGENPTVAEYSYYLGLAHEMRGETDLAKKAFGTALDNSPGYKDALKKWIVLSSKGYSLGEAEKRIKNYLDLHPDDTEIKILQQSKQAQTSGILTSPNMPEKQNPL